MKLSSIKINAARSEAGDWVENIPGMDDLRLKVRGVQNADWRRMQPKLIERVPRAERINGRLTPEAADRVQTELLIETVLIDWGNVLSDDGSPVPFSKDRARELLDDPDMVAFREAVLYAAGSVAEAAAIETGATAKNSETPSTGTSDSAVNGAGSST